MFKVNLKNYVSIGICSLLFLFIAIHFNDICDMITKIFEL